ncbi:MAG: hypothetical protein HZB39_01630 [Planctomycetes bacterium]|nr:hypothetical protein [Planctomycetota bacterium]
MNRIAAVLFAVARLTATAASQNLLPDPSFELGIGPDCSSQGIIPNTWFQASTTNPGADTWSTDCATAPGMSPSSWGHFTNLGTAHHGVRFVAGWGAANEAIGTALVVPLVAGNTYRIGGWFALSEVHRDNNGYDVWVTDTSFRLTGAFVGTLGTTAQFNVWTWHEISFRAPAANTKLVLDPRPGTASYIAVDDLVLDVAPPSPFTVIPGGAPGVLGMPRLIGTGTLLPGQPMSFVAERFIPNSPLALVIGATAIYANLLGALFVPSPDIVVALASDAAGGMTLPLTWPAAPPRITLYAQVFALDAAAPQGLSGSNALFAQGN